jgi:hypothetical protein
MATKRIPRPRDPIALAKLTGDIATGQVVDAVEDGKNAGAAHAGQKGGVARANAMDAQRRSQIAKKAASTRWQKGRLGRAKIESA